jgi:hypothetical protein
MSKMSVEPPGMPGWENLTDTITQNFSLFNGLNSFSGAFYLLKNKGREK